MNRPFSVVHLSDLHFGRIHPEILQHLDDFLKLRKKEIKLAVLTGDLTQRAKKNEFLAAKQFMESLDSSLFVVPGNHDVPLYNLFLRFLSPYKKFMKYLGPFSKNYYEDDDIAIFGLWTVDNFSVKTGKLREQDMKELEKKFSEVPSSKIKIVACHHPLISMKSDMERLLNLAPHLLMWGHEHQSGIQQLNEKERFPMILSSGTSTSSRTRAEANSFNYVTVNENEFVIEIYRHSRLLGGFEVIDRKVIPLFS